MDNFLTYMNYCIEPKRFVWVIRKNRKNEYYLDFGEVIGFKVSNDRRTSRNIWKIGVLSSLTNSKIYNKMSELNNTVFFDLKLAIEKISKNKDAVILHYHYKYMFVDGNFYYVEDIDKTKNGVLYKLLNCNTNKIETKAINNKDVSYLLDTSIY